MDYTNVIDRLPVKFLLQLRCICKSWNSLISIDPKFAKNHLRMSTKHRHLITTSWTPPKELRVMSYPLDSVPIQSIFTSKATQLDYSPSIPSYWDARIASCDGLLFSAINKRQTVLWNPCIRKKSKEFTLFRNSIRRCKTQVKVHTLGTDSWSRIKDLPAMTPYYGHMGIFISGTVNWLTYYDSNDLSTIVSLHLGKESYQEIPLPDYGNFDMLTLGVMRECLCIFSRKSSHSSLDVWLMKEYGYKEESCIKLICLSYFGDSGYFFTKILYTSEDDKHVLLVFKEKENLKWVVYDSKNDI
ncbi:F-box protein interaction domain protein [Medicago truncatula]|uniref:F-box protein interaction domain protein n=1 Tax=Medicago truncatula TaxID=3880 RepID=A0A072VNY4_MEDTR|nr:F-box protein interaction domain protein [Medicago truncatula]